MQSLIDYGQSDSALPSGHPFTGVPGSVYYWTSTTVAADTPYAWGVEPVNGSLSRLLIKTQPFTSTFVWPVRGGQ